MQMVLLMLNNFQYDRMVMHGVCLGREENKMKVLWKRGLPCIRIMTDWM